MPECNSMILVAGFVMTGSLATAASASVLFDNLTPSSTMAVASRPAGPTTSEIEAADDFTLANASAITGGSFIGLLTGASGAASINSVDIEIYRVFPQDSNAVRTLTVPTRVNSPSDVAFDSRDSAANSLSFSASLLSNSFTANNSIAPGGIHPSPNQTTGGNGPVTGSEVQIDYSLGSAMSLDPGHYFLVAQVGITDGTFYWLSGSRPISGGGTTPFAPDLQAWTRDGTLDPDWLRVGTDIVAGGATYNLAFSLDGAAAPVPEPATWALMLVGIAAGLRRKFMHGT